MYYLFNSKMFEQKFNFRKHVKQTESCIHYNIINVFGERAHTAMDLYYSYNKNLLYKCCTNA